MAISYPLAMPSPLLRRLTLRGVSVVGSIASPFTLTAQVQVHNGMRWEAEAAWPPLERADADEVLAWLLALNGMEGTFLLGDPLATSPKGSWAGTPLVDGAGQTGRSLNIKGFSLSTAVVQAGDYFQLGSGSTARLYMALENGTSDGAGNLTLAIWPRLRDPSPSDGATITTSSPKGLFRLAENVSMRDVDEAAFYGVGFRAIEALPAS